MPVPCTCEYCPPTRPLCRFHKPDTTHAQFQGGEILECMVCSALCIRCTRCNVGSTNTLFPEDHKKNMPKLARMPFLQNVPLGLFGGRRLASAFAKHFQANCLFAAATPAREGTGSTTQDSLTEFMAMVSVLCSSPLDPEFTVEDDAMSDVGGAAATVEEEVDRGGGTAVKVEEMTDDGRVSVKMEETEEEEEAEHSLLDSEYEGIITMQTDDPLGITRGNKRSSREKSVKFPTVDMRRNETDKVLVAIGALGVNGVGLKFPSQKLQLKPSQFRKYGVLLEYRVREEEQLRFTFKNLSKDPITLRAVFGCKFKAPQPSSEDEPMIINLAKDEEYRFSDEELVSVDEGEEECWFEVRNVTAAATGAGEGPVLFLRLTRDPS